jgi:hypothetical protein
MAGTVVRLIAGAAAVLSMGVAGVANAATTQAAPSWQAVGRPGYSGTVTAVTGVRHDGKTAEFAFVSSVGAQAAALPFMFSRGDSEQWAHGAVPFTKPGDDIVAAAALSPTDVLVFIRTDGGGEVLRRRGQQWSLVKTFAGQVTGASVLADNDVWVSGAAPAPAPGTVPLGVWHYDGHAWTKLASGLTGVSATSATNAWAYNGATVEHYNGKRWTAASLAALLPAKNAETDPGLAAVVATANGTAYAIGTAGGMIAGVQVLRYNGRTWSKAAPYGYQSGLGGGRVSGDGHGGLWIPVGYHGRAIMVHYVNGSHKLTASALPQATIPYTIIASIAQIPGTAEELAGGTATESVRNAPYIAKTYQYS